MTIDFWVAQCASEIPRLAERLGVVADATRTTGYGIPCNIFTIATLPGHEPSGRPS